TARAEAAERRAEAARLRSGQLLPLPRPQWAGAGDEAQALGAVLEWAPGVEEPHQRALVEAAMAAAGLLGATLTACDVRTPAWWVSPHGPVVTPNLAELLGVDTDHA